jgi:uncharacterized protein (DUF1697 family)
VPTYIALLRGINVRANNRIAMADLRVLLGSLGHEAVRTHILSGNAIFTSRRRSAVQLEAEIARAIHGRLKLDIPVLVRSSDELAAIVDGNPLPEATSDGSRFFAFFLDRNPDKARIDSVDATAFEPEQFRLGDRVIYAWLKPGFQDSKLRGALSDRRLGVTATARNWNTVTKLLELARDAG